MCMISLFFLQTWQEEDSIYLDQPIYGLGAQKGDSWLPTASKWNSTTDYFTSHYMVPSYGNHVSLQSSNTPFHSPTTSSYGLYQTSDKSVTQFGSGYDLLSAQHFDIFHYNKNETQSASSNLIQHTSPSTKQTDVSKAVAMVSQSAPTPRHAISSRSAISTTVSPIAQVAPMAITTFDADYSINNKKKTDDDPFGGGDIGGVENPDEPNMPLGDTPIIYMCLLAFGYIVIVHYRKRNTPTNH